MSFNKKFFTTGGIVASSEAACSTDSVDPFGDSSGVALYSLDYDASEAGGLYDGTPTNVDFGVGGKTNYGARFNGTNSALDTNYTVSGTGDFSCSLWVNLEDDGTRVSLISLYTGQGASSTILYAPLSTASKPDEWYFSSKNTDVFYGPSINFGQWQHVVLTYEHSSTTFTIYIDNVSIGTSNASIAIGQNLIIGAINPSGTQSAKGSIDQVRIFSKALSSGEVDTLYNNGDGETACVYTSTTDIVNYPTGTTPVAYYKLDNSSEDYSTGGNDGTDTNVEYRFGRFGQAAVFNGSSSKIDLPNLGTDLSGSNTRTLSAWVNLDANPPVYYSVVSYGTAANLESFGIYISSTGTPRISYYNLNWDTSTTLTSGNWHHIVAVYKGGNVETSNNTELYIDGVKQTLTITNSSSLTGSANTSNTNYAIGYYKTSPTGSYFDGQIDQVRIYSTALDSDQVAELYNEKPEVDTSNFKTVLYEGNGNDNRYISNLGIDLETDGGLVWTKARTAGYYHQLQDTVRGAGANAIYSNSTDAENGGGSTYNTDFGYINSFEANGWFTKNGSDGSGTWVNLNGVDYVSWIWKGGGDAVSTNNNGGAQITADVSANTEAGFSIVKYTGSGTLNQTVYHGLDEAPEIVITKLTSGTEDWYIFTTAIDGSTHHYLVFDTDAKATSSITAPTTDYIYSRQSGTIINYCFHSAAGYSKIGSYDGSPSTVTITTGFKPSFVMIKRTNSTK